MGGSKDAALCSISFTTIHLVNSHHLLVKMEIEKTATKTFTLHIILIRGERFRCSVSSRAVRVGSSDGQSYPSNNGFLLIGPVDQSL